MGVDKLFGKGKYSIISIFVENKDSEFHFREICRISNLTQPTVLQHLKVLKEIGFLKSRKNMNQKLYSINQENLLSEKIIELVKR